MKKLLLLLLIFPLLVHSATSAYTIPSTIQMTFTGTVGTSFAFPAASDTLAGLGTIQTFSAAQTFSSSVKLSGLTTGTNADFLCLEGTPFLVYVQASACTISSKRFKEHIVMFHSSALDMIERMEVDTFNMKPRKTPNVDPNFGSKQIGLIAENIAEV